MITFNDNDIFKIMNDFESVEKSGFYIVKKEIMNYGVAKEIELKGKDRKGNEFSFKYALINNVQPNVKSILSTGVKGFYIDNEKPNIFIEEEEKTEEQKLNDVYNAIENKKTEGVGKYLTREEIEELIKLEESVKIISDFKKMAVRYKEIAVKYEFDAEKIRGFIFEFTKEMKKFKPSKSYIFNNVFEKMKSK